MTTSFEAVSREFNEFTRPQMREFEKKFLAFDVNNDGLIDFFELKQAQEKMGQPKTHTELKEIMAQMATDPEKGITFHDFVKVQRKVLGTSGHVLGQPTLLEKTFAQAVSEYTVANIKDFMESKAKEQEVDVENENRIKQAAKERKMLYERQKQEKLKEEEDKKKAEAERLARREQMKARAAAFDNKNS